MDDPLGFAGISLFGSISMPPSFLKEPGCYPHHEDSPVWVYFLFFSLFTDRFLVHVITSLTSLKILFAWYPKKIEK